jgi:peptide/nickel transport system permease protein
MRWLGPYVGRRLIQAVLALAIIIVLNFLLLHLAPGDVADVLAGESGASNEEYVRRLRVRFGLDQPLHVQLLLYVRNILALDLGYSFRQGVPVLELILGRVPATLLLMTTALVLAVALGAALGVLAARRARTWRDSMIMTASLVFYASPLFWVGLMLIVLFSIKLGWFPTSGMESVAAFHTGMARVLDIAHHLVLPATTLSLFYIALYARITRAAMLEVLRLDYVTTARAKGLRENQVVYRHALRNSILPVVTMAGVQAANMLGGSVIVESVFGWPGLGQLAFTALFARDVNLLMGVFLFSSMLVVVINLMVDLVYALIDPRIQLR